MVQTRREAVEMILDIMRNGSRSDRYLRIADEDGHYYTTPDLTFLTNDGPETPPYVEIPVAEGCSESDEEEWAEKLLDDCDRDCNCDPD